LILLQRMGYITEIDEPTLLTALFLVAAIIQVAILLIDDFEDPYKMVEKLLAAILFRLPEEVAKDDRKRKHKRE